MILLWIPRGLRGALGVAFKSPKGRRGDPYPEGRVEELMAEWSLYSQNFVVKAHGTPQVHWLGLSDREHEGDWKWLDGSPVTLRQVFRVLGLSAHCGPLCSPSQQIL